MINLDYEYSEIPFPHIIIRDFIQDPELLDYLAENSELKDTMRQFRNLERYGVFVGRESESRWTTALPSPKFSDKFNRMIMSVLEEIKVKNEFRDMLDEAFRPVFEKEYPGFEDSMSNVNIMVSYGAYNAVTEAKNIIGWHIDNGNKLISGLFYLREKSDIADDGHFQITDGEDRLIKEIRYENNVFVLWPNVINSWHRATVRYPTSNLRRIINFAMYSDDLKEYHDYRTDKHDIHDKTHRSINELHSIKKFGFKQVNKL